ncbi:hypothetical protein CPC735_031440 [Coccidioides posadasii C735 delta SOWgp]|uniref:Uncharacterized protein n=2 Tax=Coccidioides posadasii TaxID=199306 RepID=E9DBR0_COCPS|nr:hypothetical protein CPC735_031440 [Coccidioides posadasii C735 delta SOWgp]EER27808.1 hypothetical protein CPC735_031440 [Coccidioides posadasii C735 delta SOWgp]EFW16212.1 conserved hypothetical protein [Coccidioides posadasii str. Silveira]|eukprot:XP_003069953.1 hypothetical protein CPC735_031440 [Coccidioides posadasii C735 delta SOWgp]
MVLVTSGTISVAISSSIIGIFTVLLFLSGYVLQQQSVRNIKAALPRYTPATTPTFVATISPEPGWRREDGFANDKGNMFAPQGLKDTGPFDILPNYKLDSQQVPIGSSIDINLADRQAYLQVLSKPSAADICSTLLLAKILASNSTLATDRIIIYPESWDMSAPTANIAAALRILRTSSERYNVILHAIDMSDPRDRHPSITRLLKRASAKLKIYERILYLRAPGVAVDTGKLDRLMNIPEKDDLASEASSPSPWWRLLFDRHMKTRVRTWIPTELTVINADLPPAVLITSKYLRPGILSRRTHVLGSSIRSNHVNSVMGVLNGYKDGARQKEPAYVYFEKNKNRLQERSSLFYLEWRQNLEGVCQGIDLSD